MATPTGWDLLLLVYLGGAAMFGAMCAVTAKVRPDLLDTMIEYEYECKDGHKHRGHLSRAWAIVALVVFTFAWPVGLIGYLLANRNGKG